MRLRDYWVNKSYSLDVKYPGFYYNHHVDKRYDTCIMNIRGKYESTNDTGHTC